MNNNMQSNVQLDVLDLLQQFFQDKILEPSETITIESGTNLLELGIIDSISMIYIFDFIKTTFGINIPEAELLPENFESLFAIENMVKNFLS